MSHDRTVKPVVYRDISHEQGQEIQRQNSESEQTRTLLDRQREQILADCQAEIWKHEFQADYDWRSIQKLNETIESQKEELHRAQADERRRQDHQLLRWTFIEAKLGSSWSSWEKSQWNERIEAISGFYIRHNCKKKIGRRSRYDPWTHRQDTGIAKWNQLYEWFERFSRCWISTQWTFSLFQSTCVFPTSSSSRWNAKPLYRNAEPHGWAAKHLGHTWYIGKRFCKSSRVFFSTLSAGIESMEFS